ncbi:hypothetical protein BJF88_04150 [Cellulosimicrobium sp. CUA-896]|nr:hypothetical protein BJF88_04150 [Cellulosimicrobium sp. CUA-896]
MPGSGFARFWMTPSSTWDPAVSERAASSRSETSASCAVRAAPSSRGSVPGLQSPTSTTFSRRSCRYSTSVTSWSSVDRPATRRSALRSARSSCSPSCSAWTVPPSARAVPARASTRATTSLARSRGTSAGSP